MKISLKLLGNLRQYLPVAGQFNRCELNVPAHTSVHTVIAQIPLPTDQPFMLMHQGDLVKKEDYEHVTLEQGDELVLLPPIKGG